MEKLYLILKEMKKRFWEDKQYQQSNYGEIVELIESFERDENETRTKLRIEVGLTGYFFFFFFFSFIFYYSFISFLLLNKFIFLDMDAASLFSMTVLLSDQFLDFKPN